jgi:hypothetical protein
MVDAAARHDHSAVTTLHVAAAEGAGQREPVETAGAHRNP